jgi:hypothetical protein
MLATLKILHFLGLAIGLGGGIAGGVVGARITSREPSLGAPVQKLIGRLSFAALIVLWVTGIWMGRELYALSEYGLWFWLKMLAVLALTAAAVTAQASQLRGRATPERMKALGIVMTLAATLAVIFSVLAFG